MVSMNGIHREDTEPGETPLVIASRAASHPRYKRIRRHTTRRGLTCPNPACGTKVRQSDIYCYSCGTQLQRYCTECKTNLVRENIARFCPHCGISIDLKNQSATAPNAVPESPQARFNRLARASGQVIEGPVAQPRPRRFDWRSAATRPELRRREDLGLTPQQTRFYEYMEERVGLMVDKTAIAACIWDANPPPSWKNVIYSLVSAIETRAGVGRGELFTLSRHHIRLERKLGSVKG